MDHVYVVLVIPEAALGKISQEGYTSLEKAQAFCESRSHNPRQVSPWQYIDEDYTNYYISDVGIK